METTKEMTMEEFDKLSPEEKSKITGTRHLTVEEINARSEKSEKMVVDLFRMFMTDILAQENIVIGHLKTDDEKESTLSQPINNLYYNAVEMGATNEDLEALQRALFALATKLGSLRNTFNLDLQKLMFVMTGENYPDSLPIKTVKLLTQAFKEQKENK